MSKKEESKSFNNYLKLYILWENSWKSHHKMLELPSEEKHQGNFHLLIFKTVPTSLHKGIHLKNKI